MSLKLTWWWPGVKLIKQILRVNYSDCLSLRLSTIYFSLLVDRFQKVSQCDWFIVFMHVISWTLSSCESTTLSLQISSRLCVFVCTNDAIALSSSAYPLCKNYLMSLSISFYFSSKRWLMPVFVLFAESTCDDQSRT